MDLGKSLGFVFEDERWISKVLIGGVISVVPILNLAAVGYAIRTLRNVAEGVAHPLPEWDDLGGDMIRGFMVTLAGLVYALPLLVVAVASSFWFMAAPSSVVVSGGRSAAEAMNVLAVLCAASVACLTTLYSLLVSAWIPAAMANYALTDQAGALFRVGEIWGLIRRNLGGYVIALLVYVVLAPIAVMLGSILLIVGAIFAGFWVEVVFAHLLGQFVNPEEQAPMTAF